MKKYILAVAIFSCLAVTALAAQSQTLDQGHINAHKHEEKLSTMTPEQWAAQQAKHPQP